MNKINVLDHGYVRLVDHMGSDLSIVRAARVSYDAAWREAFDTYKTLLAAGWPRELARSCLPVSTYSTMFATVNLLNLFKFCTLRCDPHAQHEIRVYADAMIALIEPLVPVAVAAWRADK